MILRESTSHAPEPPEGRTIYVESLGCAGNRVDGERVRRLYEEHGWRSATDPSEADLIVVQTCGFTTFQEEVNLRRIAELKAIRRAGAEIILGGCLPSINRAAVAAVHDGWTFGPRNLHAAGPGRGREESPRDVSAIAESREEAGVALVRVSTGCLDRCSYCAIPFANGRLQSRTVESIEADVVQGVARGFRTVHLVGEDIGAWGRERGQRLADLLRHLAALPLPIDFQLDNLNPNWLLPDFEDLASVLASPKVLKRFYVPAQSGSDTVLARMRRRYTAADIRAVVGKLRDRCPGARVSTDLIVGFPGESEDEFQASRELLRDIAPDFVSIYRYEDRPRIEAAQMGDKLPAVVIEERARILIADMLELHALRLGIENITQFVTHIEAGNALPVNTNALANAES